MHPPSAPGPRPSRIPRPIACCSVRSTEPRNIPAPAPTSAKDTSNAADPSGSPQSTPKTTSEPSRMNSPWTIAIPKRPSASPATIARAGVGVASIRRERPSRRVSISATALVMDVRKMNSRSSELAPGRTGRGTRGRSPRRRVVVTTSTGARTVVADSARASPSSNARAPSETKKRAARSRCPCSATAERTVSESWSPSWSCRAMYRTWTSGPRGSRHRSPREGRSPPGAVRARPRSACRRGLEPLDVHAGIASSVRTRSAPSGSGSTANTPIFGSNAPPKLTPRTRISSIGNTNTKKTFERSRSIRRTFTAAIASAFTAAPSDPAAPRRSPRSPPRTRTSRATAGRTTVHPPPPARSESPRMNHACGVSRLSFGRIPGACEIGKNTPPSIPSTTAMIDCQFPACSAVLASVATSAMTPDRGQHPGEDEERDADRAPPLRAEQQRGRHDERGHRQHAECEARQQLAAQDRAAADRRREQARERAVLALLEQARDPELHGEEQEEHSHARPRSRW